MPFLTDRSLIWATFLCALAVLSPGGAARAAEGAIEFNRDIRPILSDNCFHCHGPDKPNRKGKLQLNDRAAALERGVIKPGHPEDSEVIKRIFSDDPDEKMPPPESNKKLTPAQKELIKAWIAQGAEYQPHWSYIPAQRPKEPAVTNLAWVQNPVDAFILKNLESKNLKPSPEADRHTLLRRLSLDLTGLPPTPEEVAAFVADKKPGAYERQVDRLLSSPHYGERMAVPWLDLARFTDTVGYHGDQNQRVFPYRDYVINSYNQNKPFDQFTIEQLAGDLLPNPTVEQKVATGFNRLNMMTREGGAQPKEYIAKYAADRVRTVATTWLGSTMGCCECHDHKFDPFSAKDFYSLGAYFADMKQWGVYADYGYTPNADLRGFGNEHPFPPEVQVNSPYLKERQARLHRELTELYFRSGEKIKTDAAAQNNFAAWQKDALAFLSQNPDGWSMPEPTAQVTTTGTNVIKAKLEVAANARIHVTDDLDEKENLRVEIPYDGWLGAIRLEVLPQDDATEKAGKGVRKGTSVSFSAGLKGADGKTMPLSFLHAEADYKEERYANGDSIIGVKDTWRVSTRHLQQQAVWLLDKPAKLAPGTILVINLGRPDLINARLALSPFPAENPVASGLGATLRDALEKPAARRSASQDALVLKTYLFGTGWDAGLWTQCQKTYRDILACRNGVAFSQVTEAKEPITMRVLGRGNWQDETGEIVAPAPPHFLPQPGNLAQQRLDRLDLALWIMAPNNPLTSRVYVNRLWKQYFGTGISATVDDLGAQGEWPVHPELLDWLSTEFRDSGWNVKHMVKLLVMSSTYRQDSNLRKDLRDLDPANRWQASQSPRRLEAEFVRDNALAIAGLIDLDIGGPSAFPYQPPNYYENIQFPVRDYYASTDHRQYRRGLYAHWQRTFLQPMMANFDAPAREETCPVRTLSNTPQQGLTLLNDPTFVEAARKFAENLLSTKAASDEARLSLAFEKALARPVKDKEKVSLLKFLEEQRHYYGSQPEEAKKLERVGIAPVSPALPVGELAAWTQVGRVILNLHETITRY